MINIVLRNFIYVFACIYVGTMYCIILVVYHFVIRHESRTREKQYNKILAVAQNAVGYFLPRGRSERRTFFAQRKRCFMYDHKMSKAPVGRIHAYVHTTRRLNYRELFARVKCG